MLIRFSTKNIFSFDESIELSMIPGKTRAHKNHIVRDETWNGFNLLRLALVYGPNASGKSNLVKAMSFAKQLIVDGTKPNRLIPINCFKLDPECRKNPSRLEFEIKSKGNYYAYGFELDSRKIHSEWLYRITSKTQKKIFERTTLSDGNAKVDFGHIQWRDEDDRQNLKYVAQGTRPNQLFLTETVFRNVPHFHDVTNWFSDVLHIVFPESKHPGVTFALGESAKMNNSIPHYLQQFDTGISGVGLEPVDLDTVLSQLPDGIEESIMALNPDDNMVLHTPNNYRYYFHMSKDQSIDAFKLMTKHKIKSSDEEILFEIDDESDGTQRLLDLIPALMDVSQDNHVLVVDELNRSLHPNLSYEVLNQFLSFSSKRHSQMIVTTHESTLLDLDLLRRDEIWFTERDKHGSCSLYSLEEFAPRYDRDIRKGYLFGRFGAVPILSKKHINSKGNRNDA